MVGSVGGLSLLSSLKVCRLLQKDFPLSWMARSQFRSAMALVTAWVFSTHFISGTRTATLPTNVTTQGSVAGVASTSAITLSAPILKWS